MAAFPLKLPSHTISKIVFYKRQNMEKYQANRINSKQQAAVRSEIAKACFQACKLSHKLKALVYDQSSCSRKAHISHVSSKHTSCFFSKLMLLCCRQSFLVSSIDIYFPAIQLTIIIFNLKDNFRITAFIVTIIMP